MNSTAPSPKIVSKNAVLIITGFFVFGISLTLLFGITIGTTVITGAGGLNASTVCAMLLWCLAWFLSGAGVGFLFGLPKVNDAPAGSQPSSDMASRNLNINKNIQEISDWLTKIIVGVGLVELKRIPGSIRNASNYFAANFNNIAPSNEVGAATIVFFSILGFLAMYILMRLFLTGAISAADSLDSAFEQSGVTKTQVEKIQNAEINFPTPNVLGENSDNSGTLSSDEKSAAEQVIATPLSTISTASGFTVWARAQLKLGNFEQAVNGYQKALAMDSADAQLRFEYALALYYAGADEQVILQKLIDAQKSIQGTTDETLKRQIYEWLTFMALYVDPPSGYETAIKYCEDYIRSSTFKSGRIFVHLAAAYGQKAKDLQANNKTFDTERDAAYNAAKNAIAINPQKWTDLLRILWDPHYPNKDPQENDLEIFNNDDKFRQLLGS